MLRIGEYTIDKISLVLEQPTGVTLQLESGETCVFGEQTPTQDVLLNWAKTCEVFGTPMAMLIVDGEVRGALNHSYVAVHSLCAREETLSVWLEGRGGQYTYSLKNTDAEAHHGLLLRSQQTKRPLFLLIHVTLILAVADLLPDQADDLIALGILSESACAQFAAL